MDYIIIVAGGRGTRMGTDVPKQFLPIGGKPVLMHTIERFYDYDHAIGIIVVLPKDQQPTWQTLCERHGFTIPHRVAAVGPHVLRAQGMDSRSSPTTRKAWWAFTTE